MLLTADATRAPTNKAPIKILVITGLLAVMNTANVIQNFLESLIGVDQDKRQLPYFGTFAAEQTQQTGLRCQSGTLPHRANVQHEKNAN
ncbi:MAG: hypothetical protein P1U57_12710 [Oleibacter sp.]|nr:hypothetical protein [Thalassolituus sp.]